MRAMQRGDWVRKARRTSTERGRIIAVFPGRPRAVLVEWGDAYQQMCFTSDLRRAPRPGDRGFSIS